MAKLSETVAAGEAARLIREVDLTFKYKASALNLKIHCIYF